MGRKIIQACPSFFQEKPKQGESLEKLTHDASPNQYYLKSYLKKGG